MKEKKEQEQELIRTESNDYEIDNETKPRGESTQTIHFEYREVHAKENDRSTHKSLYYKNHVSPQDLLKERVNSALQRKLSLNKYCRIMELLGASSAQDFLEIYQDISQKQDESPYFKKALRIAKDILSQKNTGRKRAWIPMYSRKRNKTDPSLLSFFVCASFFLPCFPLVNNQPQLSIVLHYSYRLDGVKLSGGNHFFSIKNASTG